MIDFTAASAKAVGQESSLVVVVVSLEQKGSSAQLHLLPLQPSGRELLFSHPVVVVVASILSYYYHYHQQHTTHNASKTHAKLACTKRDASLATATTTTTTTTTIKCKGVKEFILY